MKKPNLTDLNKLEPAKSDQFVAAVQTQITNAAQSVRRTYSFEQRHDDHINAVALQMSQARGKPVKASEALRAIIERDMQRTEA